MSRKQPVILNSKGEEIKLTAQEQLQADFLQGEIHRRFKNQIGYEIQVTTLMKIIKKVAEQKYFEIAPADYIPVRIGEGAWGTSLTTFRSFDAADSFESGIINVSGQHGRLASVDTAVDAVNQRIHNWAKSIQWTIFELNIASQSGNWDIVEAKEKARKRNWDLGIQKVAFLGADGLNGAGGSSLGLMNAAGATVNTDFITKPIKEMTPAELKVFMANIIELYRKNVNRTSWPDRLVIPETDYNGLCAQSSPDFPIKTTLEVLEEGFARVTRKPDFKILPLPYGDREYSGLAYDVYMLYSSDDDSLRMDVPVDYTPTLANSIDGFHFQNVGYGQFTGVNLVRPLTMMQFRLT